MNEAEPDDMFCKIVDSMPENNGILMEDHLFNIKISLLIESDLHRLDQDTSLCHCVSMMMRTGASLFCSKLEHEHFTPGTAKNNAMQFRIYKWHGLLWNIISVPISNKDLCVKVAEEAEMRLCHTVPVCPVGRIGVLFSLKVGHFEGFDDNSIFPMKSERVYTLENKRDSRIYGSKEEREKYTEDVYSACSQLHQKGADAFRNN